MTIQRQFALGFANAPEPRFGLDERCVEFPEGLRTAEFTHTLHRFPGKFVPQVARELFQLINATERSLIADPFCGSGTSLIEASLLGVQSIGLDYDPLAVLISRAKTTRLSQQQLQELKSYWRIPIEEGDVRGLETAIPNLYHWFRPEIAKQLAFIKERALEMADEELRRCSLVIFSSIIRRVSNADDQTQKTYVSGTLKKTPPTPRELFPLFVDRAIKGMRDYAHSNPAPVHVLRTDARRWATSTQLDGIVTSPPYIDSIDYVYNQMLEYFWLYDVLGLATITEVHSLRREPVGFRRSAINEGLETLAGRAPTAAAMLEPLVRQISSVSVKEAENVMGYFADFCNHLECARSNMKLGAVYALVVGESYIRGVTVTTPQILWSLFQSYGFQDMGGCSYLIKRHYMKFPRRSNSRKINVDHVRCFRRV